MEWVVENIHFSDNQTVNLIWTLDFNLGFIEIQKLFNRLIKEEFKDKKNISVSPQIWR